MMRRLLIVSNFYPNEIKIEVFEHETVSDGDSHIISIAARLVNDTHIQEMIVFESIIDAYE
jgi:hypothetical protein